MKWLRRSLVAVLLLALLVALALAAYVWRATPAGNGELRLAGLDKPVRIARDAHGIPTIEGDSVRDVMFGLGVVHAQDRLWQLETHRRIGSGRLAEAFGSGAVENDRFLRALGVRRAAAAQWEQTQGESRAVLEAYAAGINTYVRQHLGARPPEMLILGVKPEDWTPVDSLAWAIMMAWDLGGNWNTEMLRLRLALRLPVARINELVPPYPGQAALVTTDYAALYRDLKLDTRLAGGLDAQAERLLAGAPPSGVEGVGSNNWVVAGSHTTTGKPLLANDPHLKLSTPSLWYFARLKAPGLDVAGVTMPGLPLVVLGQNAHIAWGFTNTAPDVQDLYLERIHPDDATRYQTPLGWASFETVREVIKVKGKPDVVLSVRSTRHGPVISDAGFGDDVAALKAGNATVIAMRWTALDPDADPVGVGLGFNRARSVDEFVATSRGWLAPMQNMVVADQAGRIAYVAPGRVPLRKAANDLRGLAPAPGWDARYDWDGFIAAEQTPREFDPARGWIATANQRIHGDDYPHFLTSEWAAPFRQQRIEQLLDARAKHSLQDLATMQADIKSLATVELLPWLQKAQSRHPLAAAAQRALEGFDGIMAADQAAPLIFWAWATHLTQAVFADEMGPVWAKAPSSRTFRDALVGVLKRDDAWWCDDKTTPKPETCAQQIDMALDAALDELQARFGADVAQWRWGKAHVARSEHRPFSKVKALAPLFELRVPTGGDTYTVNASRVSFRPDVASGDRYHNEHGPSLRALYDVGDRTQSRVMLSSGQSGLPWAPRYRSFVQPWAQVGYVPLWDDKARQTLMLKPGG